jgi:hypothetical protein
MGLLVRAETISYRGLAEGMGFEPTIGCYPYNGLAILLRHPYLSRLLTFFAI